MTDDTTWHSPAGNTPTPNPTPVPHSLPSQSAPPPESQWSAPQAPGGWTPPPKPGLIPLRPLAFGTILGASFQVMRRNPRPTFGIAVLLYGLVITIAFGGYIGIFSYYGGLLSNSSGSDTSTFSAGLTAATILAALVPASLSIVASAILEGIITLEVARGTLGEKLKLRGLWRLARGRIGVLIGWSFILIAALAVAFVVITLIVVALAAIGGVAGVVASVLLGIVLFLGLGVLSVWIGTKLSLVPSVLLLERRSIRAAVGRSWMLTKGYFWKTFGIQILVNVMISAALQIVSIPVSLIVGIGGGLVNPNGDPSTSLGTAVVAAIILGVLTIVLGAVGLVTQSAVVALIYIDIRMRKEGLDLELLRFVEARQAGDTSVSDPYFASLIGPGAQPPPAAGSPWS